MSSSPTRAHVKRIVRAPAADIFDAWTDPAAMAQWMTPVGTATADVDLRVGGRFRLVMADARLRIEHTGEYRVIQPPELLVFTWRSEFTGLRNRGEPSGFANLAAPLMSAQMRKSTGRDLRLLKSLMETRPSA